MAKASLVVMAAGMGSRYGGDKQVDGVGPNGEFLMQYSVYDAVRAGFDKVVFIIKPEILNLIKRMCSSMVEKMKTPDGRKVEVHYANQTFDSVPSFYHIPKERTKPLGTVHAVLCVKDIVKEPFCVINADDYYGVDAYRIIFEELMNMPQDGQATMVGYILKNTMSKNGAVTRGVCMAENGFLTSVKETMKIGTCPDGTIEDGIEHRKLDPNAIVSMNFWGFMPSVFDKMESYFYEFLKKIGDDIKDECLLPTMVGDMIQSNALRVSVLHSSSCWFGMTYQADRKTVSNELLRLHEAGAYENMDAY